MEEVGGNRLKWGISADLGSSCPGRCPEPDQSGDCGWFLRLSLAGLMPTFPSQHHSLLSWHPATNHTPDPEVLPSILSIGPSLNNLPSHPVLVSSPTVLPFLYATYHSSPAELSNPALSGSALILASSSRYLKDSACSLASSPTSKLIYSTILPWWDRVV
ncbi:uncharacterized protein BO88DRAFT_257377 [Aspergillus vadensis CBS 113365]|uniref:Uncharacterized protein n=1 Tax=Aspergillus vadensis (strain CBS 113365 / IMI 142717 / IBT 24658) TaxID=1448311 RepID=A0A319CP61_ASPVC|nr:hypothetical protein BO88DRAFT_257377 [Aspergillus vadensis CBS 113365]PYH70162.1 hypothetical protein BO88DRAFT_257377 [Aspergillus vadensis CBS 113365]